MDFWHCHIPGYKFTENFPPELKSKVQKILNEIKDYAENIIDKLNNITEEDLNNINGFIDKDKLMESAKAYGKSPYGAHLRSVAEGRLKY